MKNKTLTLLLVIAAVIASVGILIFAIGSLKSDVSYGTCGENLKWTLNDGTLTISGTGDMEDFGYNSRTGVSNIPTWYAYRKSIRYINIAKGVTSIGEYAFKDCKRLKAISIPKGVTRIGDSAFLRCTHLQSVTIPEGVETLEYGTFEDCKRLTTVCLPNSLKRIGTAAFSGCYALSNITIPNGVTEIGQHAFYWCKSLLSVTIPNSVTKIGHGAFELCIFLREVHLCVGVTTIESVAFEFCFFLKSVTIPNTVTRIGTWAFDFCRSLRSVTIPESVTEVEEDAFNHTRKLTIYTASPADLALSGVPAEQIVKIDQQEALARYYQDNPEQEQYVKQLELEQQKKAQEQKRKQQKQQSQKTSTSQPKSTGHMKFRWYDIDIPICGKRKDFAKKFDGVLTHHFVIDIDENEKVTTIEVPSPYDISLSGDSFLSHTFLICGTPKSDEVFMIIELDKLSSYYKTWEDIKSEYLSCKKRMTRRYGNPIDTEERFMAPYSETNQPLKAFKEEKATYTCAFNVENGMVMLSLIYDDELPAPHMAIATSYIDNIGQQLFESEE
ncbi:MAG: leucine-rich repeat domain-containing protein [Paludibacteraceae bacterium]|nr:leucine-rich repeat domain-containing protein [Paludibacteraceae bacterium]